MVRASSSSLIESRWCLAVLLLLWALLFEHVGLAQLLFSLLSSGGGQGDLCRRASRSFIGLPSPPAWGCCTQHSSRHAPEPWCCWRLKTSTFCSWRDFNTSGFNVSLSRDFGEMTPFLGSTSLHSFKGVFSRWGDGSETKGDQKKRVCGTKARAGWPIRLELVWATPRAEFAINGVQMCSTVIALFPCVSLSGFFLNKKVCFQPWPENVCFQPLQKKYPTTP